MNKRAVGDRGEAIAAAYLEGKGMACLARNVRMPGGEIDLIMRDGKYTVFVEVKLRTSGRYGLGREAVDIRKQRRIQQAAIGYLQQQGVTSTPVRFDVVEIQAGEVRHLVNAFSAV